MTIKPGVCECGCGKPTSTSKYTNKKRGLIAGQPHRFLPCHNGRIYVRRPASDRFWEKVEKKTQDECWRWLGGHSSTGYGAFGISDKNMVQASRYMLQLKLGKKLPSNIFACHTCDNRWCVNPDHLFPGTNSDNMRDASAKGRAAHGVRTPNSKLDPDKVRHIRFLSAMGCDQRAIAIGMGVSQYCVWTVASGTRWKHVA